MKHTSIIKRKEIPEFSLSGSIRIGHISTPVSYEWIPMKTEKREAIMKHFMKRTVYTAGISAAGAAAARGPTPRMCGRDADAGHVEGTECRCRRECDYGDRA